MSIIYSFFFILLAIATIFPLTLSLKLGKRDGYRSLSVFLFIVMGLIVCEGLGQIGILIRLPFLSTVSVFQGTYVIFVWFFVLLIGLAFAGKGLIEALRTIDSCHRRLFFVEKKLTEIESVQEITKILASPVYTLNEKLQKTLDIAIIQVTAEHGSIMLKTSTADELEIMAATDVNLIGLRKPIGEGIAGYVVREARTLNVEDIKLDSRFEKNFLDKYKKDSFLSIPIKIRDQVMGVLNVSDKKGESLFSTDDEEILTDFIKKVSSFIENAELYEQIEKEHMAEQRSNDKS